MQHKTGKNIIKLNKIRERSLKVSKIKTVGAVIKYFAK